MKAVAGRTAKLEIFPFVQLARRQLFAAIAAGSTSVSVFIGSYQPTTVCRCIEYGRGLDIEAVLVNLSRQGVN